MRYTVEAMYRLVDFRMSGVIDRALWPILRAVVVALSSLAFAAISAEAQEEVIVLDKPSLTFDLSGASPEEIEIFIDGEFANAFAELADGQIILNLPFTSSDRPFNVTVRLARSGDVLVDQNFRFPPGVVFDYESFEFHALETVTWKPTSRVRPSQSDFDRSDLGHDFQGSAAFEGASENWSAGGLGVFQATDDDRATLRPGGSKFDLQEGRVFSAYHDENTQVRLSAGDLIIEGDNPLINLGYQSRGIGLSSSFFQERLKLRVANTHGTDIRGFQHGLGQNSDNQRMTFDVNVEALRTDMLTIGISGSGLMAERPAEQNFGIGEINEKEKNRTIGTGLTLGMFGDRIRTRSHVAWSEHENPAEAGALDVGETTGYAQEHRIDATLWQGDTLNVTAFGEVSRGRALIRAGARVGDRLVVSGELGGAALGLHLLENGRAGREGAPFIRRHLQPRPPIGLGPALVARRWATSAIDLSDGLASDLGHLLRESGVGADVDLDVLPLPRRLPKLCRKHGLDPYRLALHGGEDYELLFSVPRRAPSVDRLSRSLGVRLTEIGIVRRGRDARYCRGGSPVRVPELGYQHFSGQVRVKGSTVASEK